MASHIQMDGEEKTSPRSQTEPDETWGWSPGERLEWVLYVGRRVQTDFHDKINAEVPKNLCLLFLTQAALHSHVAVWLSTGRWRVNATFSPAHKALQCTLFCAPLLFRPAWKPGVEDSRVTVTCAPGCLVQQNFCTSLEPPHVVKWDFRYLGLVKAALRPTQKNVVYFVVFCVNLNNW